MYTSYGNYPMSNNVAYTSYGNNMSYRRPGFGGPNSTVGANGDRVGGFLFPFVLGGITGGLLAPAFYPRPNYYPYPYYPRPYYPYPYYR